MTPPRNTGPRNGRWKGGTWIDGKGYVMVHVGREHPMANCRAYARRCRLVCFDTYGPPEPGQHAHHIDGDKTNDAPENLRWEWPSGHGRVHLTPERARELGAKGGHATARKRRKEQSRKSTRRRAA